MGCSEDALTAGHCADLVNVYDSLSMSVSTSTGNIYLSNRLSDLEYHGFENTNGVPDWFNFNGSSISINTNTTDATDGVYLNSATTSSGTGNGLTLDITVTGGAVTAMVVNNAGTGYRVTDTVTVSTAIIGGTVDVIFDDAVASGSAPGPQNSVSYADLGLSGTVYGVITDENGNAMPEGTTVTASASDSFSIQGSSSFTIGSSSHPTTFAFGVEFDEDRVKDGLISIEAETPKVNVTYNTFSFTAPAAGGCHAVHFGESARTFIEGAADTQVTVNIQVQTPVFGCSEDIVLDYFIAGITPDNHFDDVDGNTNAFSTVTLTQATNYTATVSFTIDADTDPEGTETMSAFIAISSSDTSGANIGTNRTYVLTIQDDGDV